MTELSLYNKQIVDTFEDKCRRDMRTCCSLVGDYLFGCQWATNTRMAYYEGNRCGPSRALRWHRSHSHLNHIYRNNASGLCSFFLWSIDSKIFCLLESINSQIYILLRKYWRSLYCTKKWGAYEFVILI